MISNQALELNIYLGQLVQIVSEGTFQVCFLHREHNGTLQSNIHVGAGRGGWLQMIRTGSSLREPICEKE